MLCLKSGRLTGIMRTVTVLVTALCLVTTTSAIFEEQVGLMDWSQENVGRVTHAFFPPRLAGVAEQRVMFVGTASGVIAGLKVRNGGIAWRQVLPEGDTLDWLGHDPSGHTLLALSNNCSIARQFSTVDGSLLWDTGSFSRPAASALSPSTSSLASSSSSSSSRTACAGLYVAGASKSTPSRVLVTLNEQVQLLDLSTGAVLWTWTSSKGSAAISWVPVKLGYDHGSDGNTVTVLARRAANAAAGGVPADGLAVITLHIATGVIDQIDDLPSAAAAAAVDLNSAGVLAQLQPSKASILLSRPGKNKDKQPVTIPLSSLGLAASVPTGLQFGSGSSGLLLSLSFSGRAGSGPGSSAVLLLQEGAGSGDLTLRVLGGLTEGPVVYTVSTNNDASSTTVPSRGSLQGCHAVVGAHRASKPGKVLEYTVYAVKDGSVVHQPQQWPGSSNQAQASQPEAEVLLMFGATAQLTGGAEVMRLLISRADHAVSLVQDSKLFWTREEALASIVAAELADPPADSAFGSAEENAFPGFFRRLGPQVAALLDTGRATVDSIRRGVAFTTRFASARLKELGLTPLTASLGAAGMMDDAAGAVADQVLGDSTHSQSQEFGFRKLLVAVTAPGKVFCLDSVTQQLLWSRSLSGLQRCPLDQCDWRLLSLRKAEVVIIAAPKQSLGRKSETFVYTLDAHTGASKHAVAADAAAAGADESGADVLNMAALEVIPLPHTAQLIQAHQRPVLLVDSASLEVYLLPNTQPARDALAASLSRIFFHVVQVNHGTITGYGLKQVTRFLSKTSSTVSTPWIDAGVAAVELWRIAYPRAVETISAVAHPQRSQVITATNRVVEGGRAAWNKYLNPNLLVVATVRTLPQYAAGAGAGAAAGLLRPVSESLKVSDPSVNVYLIDSISGAVIERSIQRFGGGPVSVVQSDNVVLYHYFNHKTQQYEVTVLELYEAPEAAVDEAAEHRYFSSLTAPAPTMLQQSYTFGTGVKTVAVTRTRFGITSKLFLVGLTSNQIYGLPKAFVDPRRPVGELKEADKEDGLIPYMMELPLDPTAFVSYNRTVANLRGIVTAPTLLESTSLVFAYGVDLFFSRVTPSKDFDLLSEEFNAPFLIATVSGVAIAIFMTKSMAGRKLLSEAWR